MNQFKKALPGLISLGVVILGIVLMFRYFDTETIKAYIETAGIWAPLALIVAKASTIVIAPLGGSPLYPLAGALFGFWPGFLYLLLGDALGGVVSFYLSRIFGRRVVNYFFPDNQMIDRVLRALGSVKGLLFARVAFISFPELISYSAGLTKISFIPFFLIYISIGAIPVAILTGLGSLLINGSSNNLLFTGVLVGGVVVCGAGMLAFARYVQKHHPELPQQID